jgi:hypothetical protein
MAASVRTAWVSWKLAAEMKLFVERLALVMPRRRGTPLSMTNRGAHLRGS